MFSFSALLNPIYWSHSNLNAAQPICLICFLAQQLIDITSARTVHLDGVKAPPPLHGGDSAPLLNKVFVNTPPPHHGGDSAPLSSCRLFSSSFIPVPSVVTARLTLIIQRYRPIDLHSYITLVQAVDIPVYLNLPERPAPATSSPSSLLRCSSSVLCYL